LVLKKRENENSKKEGTRK